jgi:hypothetical protein
VQLVGTEEAGFSVHFDAKENSVRVVGWGFWKADVASAFDRVVIETCLYVPFGANVSMDMSRLKPMADEGQRAFTNTVAALKDSKIGRVSVITASQLTKLQLLRLAREAAPKEKVHFV